MSHNNVPKEPVVTHGRKGAARSCCSRVMDRIDWRARPDVEALDARVLMTINFTGDVLADFPENRTDIIVARPNENDPAFARPVVEGVIEEFVLVSGFELSAIRLNYDAAADILSVGLEQPENQKTNQRVIVGDADNNLNGGTVDPRVLDRVPPGYIDFPALGGTETIGIELDFNNDGVRDVVAGIDQFLDGDDFGLPKSLKVAKWQQRNAQQGTRFGAPLQQFAGGSFVGVTASNPAFEFQIARFSQLYMQETGTPLPANPQIRVGAFAGSGNDGGASEAQIPLIPVQLQSVATLGGCVYVDADNDGIKDPGEAPIPGATVQLTRPDGTVVSTTVTGADGCYQFTNITPGTYCVKETQPAGFLDGKDTAGSKGGDVTNDLICNIVLNGGDNATDYNFGELSPPPPPPNPAQLSGCVYVDADNDGVKDPGEAPIPGATVQLTRPDGTVVATTVTGADGCYQFTNITPGTYCVRETQPAGFLDGKDTAGSRGGDVTNDLICNIVLNAGDNATDYNFGELSPPPPPPAQLSGFVYVDADNDGIKDPGEAPIPGTTITLTRPDGTVLATTTTDANGFYQFQNLAPGTYCVRETQPAGFLDGKDTAGSKGGTTTTNDQICDVMLVAGDNAINNNFGEFIRPPDATAQLSGFTYVDADNDGVKDPGETPIPGVTITLTRPDGTVVATTTTDANGFYSFVGLAAGTYCVVETQPPGFRDGKDTAGSLGGTVTNDQICDIVLVADSNSVNNNFGELLQPTNPRILINPHDQGHINTFRNQLIRVNIFGSPNFDVSQIDPTTVRLGDAAPRFMLIHRVNGDNIPDLLLVFRSQEVNLPRGPQDVEVSGNLFDGTPFSDIIRVYNQPIFFANNGASNPPPGVIPVGLNANARSNAVAAAPVKVSTQTSSASSQRNTRQAAVKTTQAPVVLSDLEFPKSQRKARRR